MFKPGDIVRLKYDNMIGKVVRIIDEDSMFIKPAEKFTKGGFTFCSIQVLIKNFELLK